MQPEAIAQAVHQGANNHLGLSISTANAPHILAAASRGDGVHCLSSLLLVGELLKKPAENLELIRAGRSTNLN
jgi:hypothetical protein